MDYQASTPVDPRVAAAMLPFLFEHPGNPHAADHAFGWEADSAVQEAAKKVAASIGADPEEIIFTSGATEANNLAIQGLVRRAPAARKRILLSSIEHKCVLAAAYHSAERVGLDVEILPVDRNGFLRLDVLEARLDEEVLLVAVMAVNNEIGAIEPIAEAAAMCRNVGALLHVDAAHALGAGSLRVQDMDIDLLSLSAHKIYGPKGIGALYVRRDLQERIEPIMYGGGQQNGLRSGTLPVPLCVAFGEATRLMNAPEAGDERRRLSEMRDQFIASLTSVKAGAALNGPTGAKRHPGNINMRFPGVNAQDLLLAVQPRLAAATGSACTSGTPEPSHVLRAIGLTADEAESCIRFGIGRFTEAAELEEATAIIHDGLSRLEK